MLSNCSFSTNFLFVNKKIANAQPHMEGGSFIQTSDKAILGIPCENLIGLCLKKGVKSRGTHIRKKREENINFIEFPSFILTHMETLRHQ